MMIDINKTYRTRSGCPVRIYATDCGGPYPIHGAYFSEGKWNPGAWMFNGDFCEGDTCEADLIEVKPRIQREVWVNVYKEGPSIVYETKQQADSRSDPARLACVKITIDCEYGEGLE